MLRAITRTGLCEIPIDQLNATLPFDIGLAHYAATPGKRPKPLHPAASANRQRPYCAVIVAFAKVCAPTLNPTSAPDASSGTGSLSMSKAVSVNT